MAVYNLWIRKFPVGKLSPNFVSEKIKMSKLSSMSSLIAVNLFRIEFIFRWPMTIFLGFFNFSFFISLKGFWSEGFRFELVRLVWL